MLWILVTQSFQQCKQKCVQESSFICRSVDFQASICHLSEKTSNSPQYTQPCYLGGWSYAERTCFSEQWSAVRSACIVGNNNKIMQIATLEDCKDMCDAETSFLCMSVDFKDGNCHLSQLTSNSPPLQPTMLCQ